MKPEILVVVSDMHCGSVVGLATPQTETEHGNVIGFGKNIHQAWLWDCWQQMIAEVKQYVGKQKPVLLINGDATEGVHHRNNAEILASNIETHVNMAVECLKPLVKLSAHSLVVKGTECHTLNMETLLAERIGAVDKVAKDEWLFEINGTLIEAKHHMNVTSRAYLEASALSIHMGNARLNKARAGHQIPKVFLRGHRHCGGYFCDGSGLFGVTGAFQLLTRHGQKVVPDSLPSPTALILDWRGKKQNSIPQIHEIKFHVEQPTIKTF